MALKIETLSFLINTFLALVVLFICIQIEILNHAADSYLPRKDSGKWRQSPYSSEKIWKDYYIRKKANEALINRPLTKDERIRMEEDVSRGRANNALLGFVSSFGLKQYFFAPLSFIWSISIAIRHSNKIKRIISSIFIVSNFICTVIMLQRGYFTSLGW